MEIKFILIFLPFRREKKIYINRSVIYISRKILCLICLILFVIEFRKLVFSNEIYFS